MRIGSERVERCRPSLTEPAGMGQVDRRTLIVSMALAPWTRLFASPPQPSRDGNTLAPSGTLRVGVYAGSPTSLIRDPKTGDAQGLTVDLGAEFARHLGVPFTLVEFPQIADILSALKTGDVDFTVTNASPERAKTVDFADAILEVELGYLARENAPIATAADVDRSGIRVGVTAGSASQATLSREFRQAVLVPAPTVTAAVAMLREAQLDAYATNKAVLFQMADQVPGSRVLDGRWGIESFAVAIPQGRREAWSALSRFVSDARSADIVIRAASRAGLRGIVN